MSRLVAFGCSLSYGDGLFDCYIEDPDDPLGYRAGPHPSSQAWPAVAADVLGMYCCNLSRSGNSNTQILFDLLHHDWLQGDVAAILWTFTERETLYLADRQLRVGPWNAESCDVSRAFYHVHDHHDLQMRTWIMQDHAALHLRSKGVPFAMASAAGWIIDVWPGHDHRTIPSSLFARPYADLGADGHHPGPRQHAIWAEAFASDLSQGLTNA